MGSGITLPFVSYIVRKIMVLAFRIIGWQPQQFGRCVFWGPESVRSQFWGGLAKLAIIDPEVHEQLLNSHADLLFWYHRSTVVDERITSSHTITDSCLAWKEFGVISRLVYALFLTQRLGRKVYRRENTRRMHVHVRRITLDWLSKHEFPVGLCQPFNEPVAGID